MTNHTFSGQVSKPAMPGEGVQLMHRLPSPNPEGFYISYQLSSGSTTILDKFSFLYELAGGIFGVINAYLGDRGLMLPGRRGRSHIAELDQRISDANPEISDGISAF